MRRLFFIFALVTLIPGCTGTRPASPPITEQHMVQDGKLLYELGRSDEARQQFELALAQTSDQCLRTTAAYYSDRIERGLPPEIDPRTLHCFGP